jgi:hypothetical protein
MLDLAGCCPFVFDKHIKLHPKAKVIQMFGTHLSIHQQVTHLHQYATKSLLENKSHWTCSHKLILSSQANLLLLDSASIIKTWFQCDWFEFDSIQLVHAKNKNHHIIWSLAMMYFREDDTINHKSKTVVNAVFILDSKSAIWLLKLSVGSKWPGW